MLNNKESFYVFILLFVCDLAKEHARLEIKNDAFDTLLIQNSIITTKSKKLQDTISTISLNTTSPCQIILNTTDTFVDCSFKGLRELNESWFPVNTTILWLNNNNIHILPDRIFSSLNLLRTLIVSYNDIKQITMDTFSGLENLEVLNLEFNSLNLNNSTTFSQLLKLKYLYLKDQKGNNYFDSTKDSTMEYPNSLVQLTRDVNDPLISLGPEFLELSNLSTLVLSGQAKCVGNTSFLRVPHIRELVLTNFFDMSSISPDSFCQLQNLEILRVMTVPVGVKQAMKWFDCLAGRTMKVITLQDIALSRVRLDINVINGESYLSKNMTWSLKQICVEEFTLRASFVQLIYMNALYSPVWDRCLKVLDLGDNPLIGQVFADLQLLRLRNLERVEISDTFRSRFNLQTFWENPEYNFLVRSVYAKPQIIIPVKNSSYENADSTQDQLDADTQSIYQRDHLTQDQLDADTQSIYQRDQNLGCLSVKLSSSIKYINIRRLIDKWAIGLCSVFPESYNVAYLDLSDCGLENFKFKISGFPVTKTAIFSANDLELIPETFFDAFPLLENVAMSTCNLHNSLLSSKGGRYLRPLKYLQWIDLSSNALNLPSPDIFKFNTNLKAVNFANNRFIYFPFSLQHTPHLIILDMSDNALTSIDLQVQEQLDELVLRNGRFHLKLNGNVFSCQCGSIQFLHWLQNTKVTLDNNRNYTCMDRDGTLTNTLRYEDLDKLWQNCMGEFFFSLSMVIVCVTGIGFLTVFIYNKNYNFIKAYVMNLFGSFTYHKPNDYTTGVFIGYADQDYKFTCDYLLPYVETTLGMTAFVRDRDLLPSRDVACGLVEALTSSWRIVLVFNETFLRADDWMWFTIRCAIFSQTPANPSRIVVIVHRQHLRHLPEELLGAVFDDNIIVVSRWEMDYVIRQKLRSLLF